MEDRNCVPSAFIFDMLAKVFDPETLLERGREAREAGRPDEASDLFLQAVAEARWAGKPALLVHALMTQGRAARSMKRLEAALHSFHEAAALCSGNGGVEAEALLEIAAVLREQEKTAEAKAAYHRALDRIQSNPIASPFDEARCLHKVWRPLKKQRTRRRPCYFGRARHRSTPPPRLTTAAPNVSNTLHFCSVAKSGF